MSTNKADNYRKMVAYLHYIGADLSGHEDISLTRTASATMDEMSNSELLHYQRVLEATIDNRWEYMDREAMKEELSSVVRERFARGQVDKTEEARELRTRLASLDGPR